MKNAILGKRYDLSLVIVGDKRSSALNRMYRKKRYTPNVLSFSLSNDAGEIFLNLRQARRECRAHRQTYEHFVALLVVHSMEHLKGMRHGGRMEEEERRILKRFLPTYA